MGLFSVLVYGHFVSDIEQEANATGFEELEAVQIVIFLGNLKT